MPSRFDPARLVFPAHRFGEHSVSESVSLAKNGVGGFCLYGGTAKQIVSLVDRLRRAAPHPLLIAADYEDGAGAWVKGWARFPANLALGSAGSPGMAREKGERTAFQARALGVDWVFAPVVDLATRPENPIVNLRAFSDSPRETERLARAYLDGLRRGGVLSSLKHFPGHGESVVDSHLKLPVIRTPRSTLSRREWSAYRSLGRKGDSVMVGHLLMPAVDRRFPGVPLEALDRGGFTRDLGIPGARDHRRPEHEGASAKPSHGHRSLGSGRRPSSRSGESEAVDSGVEKGSHRPGAG